jgi:NitT/TauT family transport system ATP-binding protein/nitrate/nitrite transport system substrate-binding protein
MSDNRSPEPRGAGPKLRIGLLRLTDAAPVIIAHEFGFFAQAGVDAELVVEPSWANIADKLAFGFIDAAVIVPPLAFAIQLGMRGTPQRLVIPCAISSGGNTITVSRDLAHEIEEHMQRGMTPVTALAAGLRGRTTTFGVVHAYSTHSLLLRYWLATAGIEAGGQLKLAVIPPERAVDALSSWQIAGFCAGAPWGEIAARKGVGTTIATSHDIWQHAPEKAFAVRENWADDYPDQLKSIIRALLRAAKFCDDSENAAYIAAVLARPQYLDVSPHAILASLPGGAKPEQASLFFRGAATFPWRSHGLWLLNEMRRWSLVDESVDLRRLAACVYRPDLYRAALTELGEPAPVSDWKAEGAHDSWWTLDATPEPIAMPADQFCDRAVFDPDAGSPSGLSEKDAVHND